MDFVLDILRALSRVMRPHVDDLSLAVAATVLTIYGNDINKAVKQTLKAHPFVMRILLFILVVSVGYGALTVFITKGLEKLLYSLDQAVLGPFVIVLFVLLGILAERKRQI